MPPGGVASSSMAWLTIKPSLLLLLGVFLHSHYYTSSSMPSYTVGFKNNFIGQKCKEPQWDRTYPLYWMNREWQPWLMKPSDEGFNVNWPTPQWSVPCEARPKDILLWGAQTLQSVTQVAQFSSWCTGYWGRKNWGLDVCTTSQSNNHCAALL